MIFKQMERRNFEKIFDRDTPYEIPIIKKLEDKIPDEPRQRKAHSKSSVAAPSADYIMYKELRHRQLITDQVEDQVNQKGAKQEEFDKIRNEKAVMDAAKTEKRRLKRLKKKKNSKK